MICPVCHGKYIPGQPPCSECGGSGFSHCCDGPPEAEALKPSFTIAADGKSITCHSCGQTSFNVGDIISIYCGKCKMFHVDEAIPAVEYDCIECGRYIYQFGGPITRKCGACTFMPGWFHNPEISRLLDPDLLKFSQLDSYAFRKRAPQYKIGDVLPYRYWNMGYSIALQYPYIFHQVGGRWLIWGRHTGRIYYVHDDNEIEHFAFNAVDKICRRMNSAPELTTAERSTINAAHDMEA